MKVAIFSYLYDAQTGGGAVRSAQTVAEGLAARGDEVIVLTTHRERRAEVRRECGVTVYSFLPWNLYWVGAKDRQPSWKKIPWQLFDTWNLHAFCVARGILRRERPDMVHAQKLRGLSPSVWATARACGIPMVHTCRDYELFSPEGTLESRVGQWAEQGAWFLRPYASLRAGFSRAVDAATAPSRYTLDAHLKRGFFPRAVSRVIPNSHGLTLEQLKRRQSAASPSVEGGARLLYLGRLEASKGVDLLCAVFAEQAARHPAARLEVAGWGTLEAMLRRKYAGHPQITFHGPVYGEQKDRLAAVCDAVLVPSVWPEVFGNVIVEAYALGKPVIAANSGGIPEVVREGETGWLIPPRDAKALGDAIERLAADPTAARRLSAACFDAARQFTVDAVVGEYSSLYHQVINNRRHAHGS